MEGARVPSFPRLAATLLIGLLFQLELLSSHLFSSLPHYLLLRNLLSIQPPLKNLHIDSDTVLHALTVAGLAPIRDPRWQRKIYGFGNVEARVETTMVGGRPRNHELALLLHKFMHVDPVLQQDSRLDKRCLVAQKLGAIFVEVLEELVREFFELFRAVKVDRVPELRPAIVQIVNRVQINILFVPAEERAPDAHVQVGLRDTGYLISLHAHIEAGFDLAEVPGDTLVEQRIRLVGTVNRSLVPQ